MLNKYSTITKLFRGRPVLEICRDQGPLSEYVFGIKPFIFGIKKANLILASMPLIKDFCDSEGLTPERGSRIKIENHDLGVEGYVEGYVECYDKFRVNGALIDRAYLKLQGSKGTVIGFGRVKARALLDAENDIRNFVQA